MAKIFLSYAREDADRAGRVASALEAAGHHVWWDRHIHAGSRFSAEIDAALNDAELVVVLWSRHAVQSPWVLDEAATGRDSGRLVPVLIEDILPPLGFRQYQAVTLSGGLARSRSVQPLVDAIAARAAAPGTPARRVHARQRTSWRVPALVAGFVFLALVGGWFLFPRPSGSPTRIVAVDAAEGGEKRRSQDLARTIAADLGRYRAGTLGALTILRGADGKAKEADYRVEVGVLASANDLRADVSLLAPKDAKILWTASVEGRADRLVDLRQQIVAKLGDVLGCAVEAGPPGRGLDPEILGLYLNGCGRLSDVEASSGDETARSIFRQITERAPDFAPGWANLVLLEIQSFPGTPPPEHPALAAAVRSHLARARQLDPALPEVVAANALFHPQDGTKPAHALAVLDQGLEAHPDSALLHGLRSQFLRDIGRLNEGVAEAERAMRLNPLSPSIRDAYISSLAYAGRTSAAFRELANAEKIWPGSTVLRDVRYRLDLRYGDPETAMRMLKERGAGDLHPVPMDTAWQRFIEARIEPSPVRIEKALAAFRDRYRRDPGDIPGYLQALGTFGRADEAYRAVAPAETLDSMLASTDTLFRTHMRSIRADPRFIGLAARLGLLAYWRKSGVWPDFCEEPRLPYDCKEEAERAGR